MKAKLIVHSIVHIAPPIYKTPYGVGIVEDADGNRMLAKIKNEYLKDIKAEMNGEVKKEIFEDQELNFFYPSK